ncbi:MAG: TAXI family TRAP transporter solute-binding subunit [Deltaproteobacteria bacterium]|nr:TAXI family TRAP transporter solute-binding subunit [Deltaproteobacteria bacterium]
MLAKLFRSFLYGVAVVGLAATGAAAQTLTLASDAPGSTYNAIASGMAKVITEGSSVRVIVRPFGGPDNYLDQLNNGEVNLATLSSSTAYISYIGDNRAKKEYKNLRVLRSGDGGLFVSFIVLKDSDIKTVSDLKGRRVTSDFGGHAIIGKSLTGALATAGLTWKDVRAVPVTGANDGPHALDTGRVDASWASLGQPVVRELHAKKGIRYLGFDKTPANLEILRQHIFPNAKLELVKKNPGIGVENDIYLLTYDAYLVAHKDVDGNAVKTLLEALWKGTGELAKIHRALAGFTHQAAVTDLPVIPYHPAAVAFYKEKGLWTEAAQKANAKFN